MLYEFFVVFAFYFSFVEKRGKYGQLWQGWISDFSFFWYNDHTVAGSDWICLFFPKNFNLGLVEQRLR